MAIRSRPAWRVGGGEGASRAFEKKLKIKLKFPLVCGVAELLRAFGVLRGFSYGGTLDGLPVNENGERDGAKILEVES